MKKKPIVFYARDTEGDGQHVYRVTINPGDPITTSLIEWSYTDPKCYGCWDHVGHGIGVLKHGDLYNRETGAHMALKSALRVIDPHVTGANYDEIRTVIWAEYLKLFPVAERKAPLPLLTIDDFINALSRLGMVTK